MNIRIFRKALLLLIVDIVIIIGIFVLQFRTDSSIIEKIGNMQLTLEYLEKEQNVSLLKNKFIASYNGLTLYCDEQNPVTVKDSSGKRKALKLTQWEKLSDLSCRLSFTDDVEVVISLSSESPTATLTTNAILPSSVSEINIPYNYSYNMNVQKRDSNRVVVDGKKNTWETMAYSISPTSINLHQKDTSATYSVFDTTVKFTFDNIIDLEIANKDAYENTIANFKQNLISSFKANTSETSLTEQSVVSYVAVMAESNMYSEAIEEIPQSFKKSNQRTYLSAPYFNTLEAMNQLLEKEIADNAKLIKEAAANSSLDIFNMKNLATKLCVYNKASDIEQILSKAGSVSAEQLTVSQATGIIQAYVELSELNPDYARHLISALGNCVTRITDACTFDGEVLTISENDTFVSVVQAVQTGIALLRYGIISGNNTLTKAGRVIINSYIGDKSSFDLRTLANVYPILAYNNSYYPHYERIRTNDNKLIWAWTIAKEIRYEKDSEDSIVLTVDFPEGLTHYVIVKGIPQFSSIYIYNMAFRTDPRFETYNSSGYVYKTDTQTLLLKSRHKARFEPVKLEYKKVVSEPKKEEPDEATDLVAAEQLPASSEQVTESSESKTDSAAPATTAPSASSVPARQNPFLQN